MTIPFLINLLVLVLIGGLVVYILFMAIDHIPLPAPFNNIAKAIVLLIAAVALANRAGLF